MYLMGLGPGWILHRDTRIERMKRGPDAWIEDNEEVPA